MNGSVIPPVKQGRPVFLKSSVTVQSNATGAANSAALMNPNGEAMEIYELRFHLRPTVPGTSGSNATFVSGGQFGVALSLGKLLLTNGAVPVWLIGLAKTLNLELQWNSIGSSCDAFYSWTLKHPLYVPPGASIEARFNNFGLSPFSVDATIMALGKTISDHKRTSVKVPWVCGWKSRAFEINETGSDISTEKDLVNQFDSEVSVERFSNRVAVSYLPRSAMNGVWGTIPDVNDYGTAGFTGLDVMRIQMHSSVGYPIIRQPINPRLALGARNRAWQIPHALPAYQYVKVSLLKQPIPLSTTVPFVGSPILTKIAATEHRAQLHVGMIGWREVTL